MLGQPVKSTAEPAKSDHNKKYPLPLSVSFPPKLLYLHFTHQLQSLPSNWPSLSLPFLSFRIIMAPKNRSQAKPPASRTWTTTLTITAVVVALFSAVYLFLDSHLEWFYIFSPEQLKDVSQRAIAAHGNDTTSVVKYIVDELSEKLPGGYVNLDEEWIFNNAGGAMGAMYIIHASKYPV